MTARVSFVSVFMAIALCSGRCPAQEETKVELTAAGKALADKYAAMLSALQADLKKQLPQIDNAKQQAIREAMARTPRTLKSRTTHSRHRPPPHTTRRRIKQ